MAQNLHTDMPGKSHHKWREMWIGAAAANVLPIVGVPFGAAVGFVHGMMKDRHEDKTGEREVRAPSLINGGLAKGMMLAPLAAGALAVGTLVLTGGLGFGGLALAGTGAGVLAGVGMAAVAPAVAMIGFAAAAATAIIMPWKMALDRRGQMKEEYRAAKEYNAREPETARPLGHSSGQRGQQHSEPLPAPGKDLPNLKAEQARQR